MPIVEDPLVGRDIASGALPERRRYKIRRAVPRFQPVIAL